jgi:hypothetical protein
LAGFARGDFARLVLIALGGIPPVIFRMLAFHSNPDLRVLDCLYYHSHMRFDEVFVGVFIAYVCRILMRCERSNAGWRWVPAVGLLAWLRGSSAGSTGGLWVWHQ